VRSFNQYIEMSEGLVVTNIQGIPQDPDFLQEVTNAEDKVIDSGKQALSDDQNDDGKQPPKRRKRGKSQDTEARKESHKLIEQKRRQRINEKINELRELLNYPDGSQNKSVVLQAAVENIRYLKMACSRMLQHYRQMAEEHSQLVNENDRMRKLLEQAGIKITPENVPVSSESDKGNGDAAKLKALAGIDFPAFFSADESNAQAISVLSSSLSVSPLARGTNSAIQMIPNNIPTYGSQNPFGNSAVQDGIVVNSGMVNSGQNQNTSSQVSSTPASSLSSTETENGVTITRLVFTPTN